MHMPAQHTQTYIDTTRTIVYAYKYEYFLKVNLYPAVGTVQKNTSLVDISSPDYEKHPLFREAKGEREEIF